MSNDIVKEKNGTRIFEKFSRWNTIDYTIISDKHRYAEYADNYDKKSKEKLTLTYFNLRNHMYPINLFAKLSEPIILEDGAKLTRQNVENLSYYLEVNADKTKVRVYKEI